MYLKIVPTFILLFFLFLSLLFVYKYYYHGKPKVRGKVRGNIDIDKVDVLSQEYIANGNIDQEKLFSKKNMNTLIQKENLILLNDFLKRKYIKYYIDCGTLLGAIREDNLIDGDTDADIMVSEDGFLKIKENLNELENIGFIAFRINDDIENWFGLSILRKGEYIDVYRTSDIKFELPLYYFLDSYFYIPKYYKEYLSDLYGENWMIPDPNGKGNGTWELGMLNYKKKYNIPPSDTYP
jgi:hypothetical protein